MAEPNANEGGATTTATTDDDKRPLTLADLRALFAEERKETARIANQAITSHSKREREKAEKQKAEAEKQKADGDAETTDGDEGTGTKTPAAGAATTATVAAKQPDPELLAMRKEVERLKKQTADEKAARQKAERARAEEKGHSSVRSALGAKVAPDALGLAIDALRARGAIHIDDDGNVRMRFGGQDEPEDGFDLNAGVEAFLKTKEAAFLKPAANPSGGNRWNPGDGGSSGKDPFRARTGVSLDDAL